MYALYDIFPLKCGTACCCKIRISLMDVPAPWPVSCSVPPLQPSTLNLNFFVCPLPPLSLSLSSPLVTGPYLIHCCLPGSSTAEGGSLLGVLSNWTRGVHDDGCQTAAQSSKLQSLSKTKFPFHIFVQRNIKAPLYIELS